MTIDGATDAEVFRLYVEPGPHPTLRPGDIVIMEPACSQSGGHQGGH
jgi:hypothetical protein